MKLLKFTQEEFINWSKTGIYKITHSYNPNIIYIGQAACFGNKSCRNGFYFRWLTHLRDLTANRHHNTRLQRIINKYGIKDLQFTIISYIDFKESIEYFNIKELEQIEIFKLTHDVLNFSTDSKSFKGMKHTKETKEKLSKFHKGKKMHINTYNAIMKANIGRIKSQEEKDKIGAIHKGRIFSKEHREKISKSRLGKSLPNRRKVIATNNEIVLIFDDYIKAAEYFNSSYSNIRALCSMDRKINNYSLKYEIDSTRTNIHSTKTLYVYDENNNLIYEFKQMKDLVKKLNISKGTVRNHMTLKTKFRAYPNYTITFNKIT